MVSWELLAGDIVVMDVSAGDSALSDYNRNKADNNIMYDIVPKIQVKMQFHNIIIVATRN